MEQVKLLLSRTAVMRHSLARKLGKPIVLLESMSHGGYCYFVWLEGHELISLFAGGMLVCILVSVALGSE
jgi:hypothetical protein